MALEPHLAECCSQDKSVSKFQVISWFLNILWNYNVHLICISSVQSLKMLHQSKFRGSTTDSSKDMYVTFHYRSWCLPWRTSWWFPWPASHPPPRPGPNPPDRCEVPAVPGCPRQPSYWSAFGRHPRWSCRRPKRRGCAGLGPTVGREFTFENHENCINIMRNNSCDSWKGHFMHSEKNETRLMEKRYR